MEGRRRRHRARADRRAAHLPQCADRLASLADRVGRRRRCRRRLAVDPAAGDVPADDATVATPLARSNALSDVLAKGAGDPLVVLGALLLAIALGALHALEPVTERRCSPYHRRRARKRAPSRDPGDRLTVAHTAGVLALGAVLLLAAQWIVPEQIYPWITLASGVLVTVLGARAIAREVRVRLPYAHVHSHAHPHAIRTITATYTRRCAPPP